MADTLLKVDNINVYYGNIHAVKDISFEVDQGEIVTLIGANGAGKSTTLKMINRLVEHDSGMIRFAGEEIRSLPVLELRRRMGYAIQSIGLFPHWTVAQNIATVPRLLGWNKKHILAPVRTQFDKFSALFLPPAGL